jgi:hypothetical protein
VEVSDGCPFCEAQRKRREKAARDTRLSCLVLLIAALLGGGFLLFQYLGAR